ncbi:hypothetical protein BLNAU_9092 [Blattamonas nauphoetae]|uniref:Uncharacterized protein n=1 Tax=Blattamonas nauphoetae TaxID=2049346 RepID=A0ABQ9XWR8_9EUKA|nr:hypothetical protein BLNAU_9092 [Blattamonas nauphoetae]
MSTDQTVTIIVDADKAPLVDVTYAEFKLKAVSIIPSPNYVFVKANEICTIVFDEVIHNYLESDAHVVFIDLGTVEFISNTFLPSTKLHKSLIGMTNVLDSSSFRTLRIIDTDISHVLPQTKDSSYGCANTVTIENTTFTNCTAPLGGGIIFGIGRSLITQLCSFGVDLKLEFLKLPHRNNTCIGNGEALGLAGGQRVEVLFFLGEATTY